MATSQFNCVWEHSACGRCRGSGSYSFNATDGSRCYGCGGTGYVLTKRGAAAYRFYQDSLKVKAGDLKVGDLYRASGVTGSGKPFSYFATVTSIEPARKIGTILTDGVTRDVYGITIHGTSKFGDCALVTSEEALVRKGWDSNTKAAKQAAALDFQASLTKTGKRRNS